MERRRARAGAVVARERGGVDLQPIARGQEGVDGARVAHEPGRALGMADEDAEAALAQRAGAVGEALGGARARQRRLEQQPAPAGRPLGDGVERGDAERGHVVPRELGARTDLEVDTRPDQRGLELLHPCGNLGDIHVRRMRRAGDEAGSVAHGLAGQRERDAEVARPVVDVRQQVEVKLDAIHPCLE